ncbi:hypothetical protein BABINDRAFT_174282 [Babjeviella inositovora NRRL Y-12698]|uniref:Pop1 N-terminal domain-containing protein n=1 Tax=Babjeviella inositovora NRRL Y-12698 TaxID=984486 RepID=A0A1E3QXB8_9ASCO|nr:uncharacterized protein BABINDRAFT_174282 [Babjeviella inositovora NRRL Y-12698]ODQ81657.1 hypothetical protein BABINDRAFT_174282 [Babjeviella inositovora NRRL Y-12698]
MSKRPEIPGKPFYSAKKQRLFNSRTIRTENVDPAFSDGKLDVPSFMASREYEIRQLEHAQLRSKYSASTRVFQSLPRTLRRRAASHNVKRIPKRLRARALKEMANQNATKKTHHPRGRALYRLKMQVRLLKLAARHKLLQQVLPPEMAAGRLQLRQRIQMLQDRIKLAKEGSARLNNAVGAYDNSAANALATPPVGNVKYMKRQTEHTWLATHVWHTKRAHLVKKWGFQIPYKPTQKCFRAIHRGSVADGGVVFDTSYFGTCVVEAGYDALRAIASAVSNGKALRRYETRSWHGMVFQEQRAVGEGMVLWAKDAGKLVVRVHPSIYAEYFAYLVAFAQVRGAVVHDCRYALGSMEIIGPVGLQAVGKVFHPVDKQATVVKNWFKATSVADVSTIPQGTTFAFEIYDPRLWGKPTAFKKLTNFNHNDLIIDLHGNPAASVDAAALAKLLSSEGRTASYANQATLSELGKRRARTPGQPIPVAPQDPTIPVVVTKGALNKWIVLMPWFWVLPTWHILMRVPHVRLGGLRQLHQLAFEQGKPFYPYDFPFLREGLVEARLQQQELAKKWRRTPAGKRVSFSKVELNLADPKGEIGSPFACDWRYLQLLQYALVMLRARGSVVTASFGEGVRVSVYENMRRQITQLSDIPAVLAQAARLDAERAAPAVPVTLAVSEIPELQCQEPFAPLPVVQLSIVLAQRGQIKDFARVYKIPQDVYVRTVATLKNNGTIVCPGFENLVGFVSSGTFNLAQGFGTGVGCVDAAWARNQEEFVLVRNVGTDKVWLARWKKV